VDTTGPLLVMVLLATVLFAVALHATIAVPADLGKYMVTSVRNYACVLLLWSCGEYLLVAAIWSTVAIYYAARLLVVLLACVLNVLLRVLLRKAFVLAAASPLGVLYRLCTSTRTVAPVKDNRARDVSFTFFTGDGQARDGCFGGGGSRRFGTRCADQAGVGSAGAGSCDGPLYESPRTDGGPRQPPARFFAAAAGPSRWVLIAIVFLVLANPELAEAAQAAQQLGVQYCSNDKGDGPGSNTPPWSDEDETPHTQPYDDETPNTPPWSSSDGDETPDEAQVPLGEDGVMGEDGVRWLRCLMPGGILTRRRHRNEALTETMMGDGDDTDDVEMAAETTETAGRRAAAMSERAATVEELKAKVAALLGPAAGSGVLMPSPDDVLALQSLLEFVHLNPDGGGERNAQRQEGCRSG
jgi:hypothetical protein